MFSELCVSMKQISQRQHNPCLERKRKQNESKFQVTYQQLWVPSRWTQLWAHVCLLPFHWRKCWMNRLPLRRSCPRAFDHRAGCRAPGSTAPSMHCPSARQPGPHGWRYIHAETEINMKLLQCSLQMQSRIIVSWDCLNIEFQVELIKRLYDSFSYRDELVYLLLLWFFFLNNAFVLLEAGLGQSPGNRSIISLSITSILFS